MIENLETKKVDGLILEKYIVDFLKINFCPFSVSQEEL